jgi:electron transfer flavoprotein alpha subunit
MSQVILAITEQFDGSFKNVSFEVVSAGRKLAEKSGVPLIAAVMGAGIDAIAGQAADYGAERILVADHEGLKDGLSDAFIQAAEQLIKTSDPAVVLIGATSLGKDIAAVYLPVWMLPWPWIVLMFV